MWWIAEVLPISATALLPLVIFPLSGAIDISSTAAAYGHRFVFLYLGGFLVAIGIEKWNLHKRIALLIIRRIGTSISMIILGFMCATALLSMWISNTATAVMMLPIGMAIVAQLEDNPATIENENRLFGKALMLAIAYSASIGGVATLIGTPPNLVLAGVVSELLDQEISFLQWFVFGFPIAVVLLLICWLYLTKFAFDLKMDEFPGGRAEIQRLLAQLGPLSREERTVLVVFLGTAMLWISRSLIQQWVPKLDDTIIAIMAGLLLFALPSPATGGKILRWEDTAKLPWGVILLFGGGMAIAEGFQETGLAQWIGTQLSQFDGISVFLFLVVVVMTVNFLTEITSNLATTAMILPILVPMALSMDIPALQLLVAATTAASCAFMLPVATPPNAIVFGSGYLSIKDMFRTGLWLNILSIALLSLAVYYYLPLVWAL